METVTFEYNGATLEVRRETVRDIVMQEGIEGALAKECPNQMARLIYRYSAFMTTTTVTDGDLGFEIPKVADGIEALVSGMNAFYDADRALYLMWIQAYRDVNGPKAETVPETESETS